jgi:hypothetical protein
MGRLIETGPADVVDVLPYLENLAEALRQCFVPEPPVALEVAAIPVKVPAERVMTLGMIATELVDRRQDATLVAVDGFLEGLLLRFVEQNRDQG